MADAESVAHLIDSTASKLQQLQQAFSELEGQRAVSLSVKWKQLEEHFHGLERSLKQRFSDLEDGEREYETRALEARTMLEKQETIVMAKEQASLELLQEKRDAALLSIGEAFEQYMKNSTVSTSSSMSSAVTDATLEDSLDSELAEVNSYRKDTEVNVEDKITKRNIGCEVDLPAERNSLAAETKLRLVKLCQEMDVKGIHKFVSDNRKDLGVIREEIPLALKNASDPACLVLNSLEGFYEKETFERKRDPSLLGIRRTCIMLMECLFPVTISADTRQRAKAIAQSWKLKLNKIDVSGSTGNSLEVQAFLQLLVTFEIVEEFDKDEICKLIPCVTRRHQTADLCRALELQDKIPGVIKLLIDSGRNIEAVNMAYAFQLTAQFDPVALLKAYPKEARKYVHAKSGNTSPSVMQNEANERELAALRAVMRCVEEHKLENLYPLDSLLRKVTQLEKAKADKKRTAEAARPQPKRARANVISQGLRSNVSDMNLHKNHDRYLYTYENPYLYAPLDAHSVYGSVAFNLSPTHGGYFGNSYQYPVSYMHS